MSRDTVFEFDVLYGQDSTQRIVAVEPDGPSRVRLFIRTADGNTVPRTQSFFPWLVTTGTGIDQISQRHRVKDLSGEHPLNRMVRLPDWNAFRDARSELQNASQHYYARPSLVEQYLLLSGVTLFKSMDFTELRRLQIDVETTSLDNRDPAAEIVAIAIRFSDGFETVIDAQVGDERARIMQVTHEIQRLDPDIIEGHNLFQFDLPYLIRRAEVTGATLAWGRDGSTIRETGSQRFRAGARAIPFPVSRVYGRHLLDTYHQVQRYDTGGDFESYGLKQSVASFGIERLDREFVTNDEIEHIVDLDPDRLRRYALDDVRDVDAIASTTSITDFFQTQMIPRTFQDSATGGTGEKINLLLVRAYLAANHSLPLPQRIFDISGGYTEVRRVGVFRPVVKCDVESLYPAIMLADQIRPNADSLDIFLKMLGELTTRRLEAKRAFQESMGPERYRWNGLQSSFKVLINSFYGYLGWSAGMFNDAGAADRITRRGQELIRTVVDELERAGALAIEIDTDGAYFQPPESVANPEMEQEFIDRIGESLPERITLAHDGSFAGMISLKVKNYALVNQDGSVTLKGSSLRSRRDEPVLRAFLGQAVHALVLGEPDKVRSVYFAFARRITERAFSGSEVSRTESITEKTFSSSANRRLAAVAAGTPEGERVNVYERDDGSLGLLRDYREDANRSYLLRRLRDTAQRFAPLFENDYEFDHVFPEVSPETDLGELWERPRVQQMNLFG